MNKVLVSAAVCALLAAGLSACGSSGSSVVANTAVVDAIIGCRDGDSVVIFKDILNHSGLGADVVLDNAGSGIDNGGHLAAWNDWLAVSNRYADTVTLYNGISTLTSGQAPDVTLSGFSCPAAVQIVAGDLYVCDRCNNDIKIYRDVTTLSSGDGPDAVLDTSSCPVDLQIAGNRLFVCCRCTSSDTIMMWDSPALLTGGEAPTATLDQNEVRRIEVAGDVLWTRTDNDSAPVWGYSGASTLMSGAVVDRAIFGFVPTGDRGPLVVSGSDVWVGNQYEDDGNMLARVKLDAALITSPEAVISHSALGSYGLYDIQLGGEVLVGTMRQGSYGFYYSHPRSITDDQLPDGFLFDPRISQAKDLVLIVH